MRIGETLNRQIGYRIMLARKRANINQATLAKAIGYKTSNAVHKMEVGVKLIRVVDLIRIAKRLNCTIRSFFPKGSVR